MFADGHGAHAGSATSVRDTEGLVQVEVADIGAELSWLRQSDQGMEVCAVDINLATCIVHHCADVDDRLFENPVSRGVGHHQRCETFTRFGDLLAKIGHVDVAEVVALHHDDLHARHDGTRGVGAMRRRRDEAHIASVVATRVVVAADRE